MRYLILSDIHANREALEAVMEAAHAKYDRIVCCGDLVGYGADPGWVIEWARETRFDALVRGNHDKACAGLDDLEWFNASARASALWTRQVLGSGELAFLANLARGPVGANGFTAVHGSPVDEDEYILHAREAAEAGAYLDTRVTFFGHTHLQGGFQILRNAARPLRMSPVELEPDWDYLINPGSVGQPRDGDPRAAYCIYSSEDRVVEFYRVAYDVAKAQSKIRGAGLPRSLADRLARGA